MKDVLKDLLFFSCLSNEQMGKAMSYIESLELNSGDILFKEGDSSDFVCFITSGSLEVAKMTTWQNLTTVIAELEEGSCIGGLSLVDHQPRSATVRANKKTSLAVLTQEAFDTMVKTEPELAINVLKGVVQTLSENLHPKMIDKVAA